MKNRKELNEALKAIGRAILIFIAFAALVAISLWGELKWTELKLNLLGY